MEEWVDIVGYEGLYKVSSHGRIKSLGRNTKRGKGVGHIPQRIMSPSIGGRGYYQVTLSDINGNRKTKYVHALVATAFIPNPESYGCIDHINTIKTDNTVSNLRWCNHQMNMRNPITKTHLDNKRLEYCNESWYIEKQRYRQPHGKSVLQFNLDNSFVKEWRTISEAARSVGTSVQAISRCCNGVVKTSMNYIWKFKK